jgi:hypothetical protein
LASQVDSEPPSKKQKKVVSSKPAKDTEPKPESEDQNLQLPNIKTIMIDNSSLLAYFLLLLCPTLLFEQANFWPVQSTEHL